MNFLTLLMLIIPGKEIVIEKQPIIIQAEITAYNATESQTDNTPDIVASGKKTKVGMAACPSWLKFGTEIKINGKKYVCEDRMHQRFRNGKYFDLLVETHDEAIQFGRKLLVVEILN